MFQSPNSPLQRLSGYLNTLSKIPHHIKFICLVISIGSVLLSLSVSMYYFNSEACYLKYECFEKCINNQTL